MQDAHVGNHARDRWDDSFLYKRYRMVGWMLHSRGERADEGSVEDTWIESGIETGIERARSVTKRTSQWGERGREVDEAVREGEGERKREAWLSGVGGRPCKDVLLYFLFVAGRSSSQLPCCRAANQPTSPTNKPATTRRITRQQTKSCVTPDQRPII